MCVNDPVTNPIAVEPFLTELTAALINRDLAAESVGARMVWAKNTAADPDDANPLAARLSPGLRQAVICQPDNAGGLAWFWMWSGPTRQAPPEFEYLCAAEEIDQAADRIAHVLRLGDVDRESLR